MHACESTHAAAFMRTYRSSAAVVLGRTDDQMGRMKGDIKGERRLISTMTMVIMRRGNEWQWPFCAKTSSSVRNNVQMNKYIRTFGFLWPLHEQNRDVYFITKALWKQYKNKGKSSAHVFPVSLWLEYGVIFLVSFLLEYGVIFLVSLVLKYSAIFSVFLWLEYSAVSPVSPVLFGWCAPHPCHCGASGMEESVAWIANSVMDGFALEQQTIAGPRSPHLTTRPHGAKFKGDEHGSRDSQARFFLPL